MELLYLREHTEVQQVSHSSLPFMFFSLLFYRIGRPRCWIGLGPCCHAQRSPHRRTAGLRLDLRGRGSTIPSGVSCAYHGECETFLSLSFAFLLLSFGLGSYAGDAPTRGMPVEES